MSARVGHKRAEYIFAVAVLLILPAINGFLLAYIRDYYAEDIFYGGFSTAAGYISALLSELIPFLAFGVTVGAVIFYGAKNSVILIVLSYISLLIPYGGGFFTGAMLSSEFRVNLTYYLAYTALNYLAVDAVIMTAVLLISIWARRRKYPPKTQKAKDNAKTRTKPFNPVIAAAIGSAAVCLAFELALQIYDTAKFVYSLMYEYYAPITFNELIAVITDFLVPVVKAVAGYAVIRLVSAIFGHERELPAENSEDAAAS